MTPTRDKGRHRQPGKQTSQREENLPYLALSPSHSSGWGEDITRVVSQVANKVGEKTLTHFSWALRRGTIEPKGPIQNRKMSSVKTSSKGKEVLKLL